MQTAEQLPSCCHQRISATASQQKRAGFEQPIEAGTVHQILERVRFENGPVGSTYESRFPLLVVVHIDQLRSAVTLTHLHHRDRDILDAWKNLTTQVNPCEVHTPWRIESQPQEL